MSLTLALILSAGATAAPAPTEMGRWLRVVSAARQMDVPTPHLFDALASAAPPRRGPTPRYCFEDRLSDPAAPVNVCRTRAEWLAFGLDPIAEDTGAG